MDDVSSTVDESAAAAAAVNDESRAPAADDTKFQRGSVC